MEIKILFAKHVFVVFDIFVLGCAQFMFIIYLQLIAAIEFNFIHCKKLHIHTLYNIDTIIIKC